MPKPRVSIHAAYRWLERIEQFDFAQLQLARGATEARHVFAALAFLKISFEQLEARILPAGILNSSTGVNQTIKTPRAILRIKDGAVCTVETRAMNRRHRQKSNLGKTERGRLDRLRAKGCKV